MYYQRIGDNHQIKSSKVAKDKLNPQYDSRKDCKGDAMLSFMEINSQKEQGKNTSIEKGYHQMKGVEKPMFRQEEILL